jgi:hypothetical protein
MGRHNGLGRVSSATNERRRRGLGHAPFPNEYAHRMVHLCTELNAQFIPSNTLDLVKREWEELSLKKGKCVTVFNERFRRRRSTFDPHQPVPAEMSADA